jgi:hypothetical protein
MRATNTTIFLIVLIIIITKESFQERENLNELMKKRNIDVFMNMKFGLDQLSKSPEDLAIEQFLTTFSLPQL